MKDHYATLGVAKDASADEIKRAFRRLASQHHPDKGGDTRKFQEIQAAYEVLGNEQKRAEYDNPAQPFQFQNFGGSGFPFSNIHDIFNMFGQGGQHPRRNHVRMSLYINLSDVATGGRRTVSVSTSQGSQTVEIDIPLGLNDGDSVQYSGIAPGGQDLVITFRIQPHRQWHRNALDLTTERAVSVWDLIVGGDITVEDILGSQITVRIPAKCQPGTALRIRGHGLKDRAGRQGDMFLRLAAKIPDVIPEELVEAIQKYRQ